jgi:hypothetical protein
MKPKTIPDRIVIHPRDVSNITGQCIRTCRRLLQDILRANKKPTDGFVTFKEFVEYTNIPEEEVRSFLKV